MIPELISAAMLGLLTAISPCPLATNIAAVSFIGRHAGSPSRSLRAGLAYVVGRTLCYVILAAALAAGLLAATTTSETLNRILGLMVGPVLVIAGAMLAGLIPLPHWPLPGRAIGERLAARGDSVGSFALGALFALSFCPSSAALFFGGLMPLAAKAQSALFVPMVFGIATGLPVLAFAMLLACGVHRAGRAFDRLAAIEKRLRLITALVLIGVGLYLCFNAIVPD